MYPDDPDRTQMNFDDLGTLFPNAGAAFSQCTQITQILLRRSFNRGIYALRDTCSYLYRFFQDFIWVLGTNAESRAIRGLDRTQMIWVHLGTRSGYGTKPGFASPQPCTCCPHSGFGNKREQAEQVNGDCPTPMAKKPSLMHLLDTGASSWGLKPAMKRLRAIPLSWSSHSMNTVAI
jgi:hypothetical protein